MGRGLARHQGIPRGRQQEASALPGATRPGDRPETAAVVSRDRHTSRGGITMVDVAVLATGNRTPYQNESYTLEPEDEGLHATADGEASRVDETWALLVR